MRYVNYVNDKITEMHTKWAAATEHREKSNIYPRRNLKVNKSLCEEKKRENFVEFHFPSSIVCLLTLHSDSIE